MMLRSLATETQSRREKRIGRILPGPAAVRLVKRKEMKRAAHTDGSLHLEFRILFDETLDPRQYFGDIDT